jgi:YidC/Oxa1 family membrane protein insertase
MNLDFLYIAVSWVLLRWHQLFTAACIPSDNGWTWTLSIMFLVITARLLLFRPFLKQVHYQRNIQKIQPKIQKLRREVQGRPAGTEPPDDGAAAVRGFEPACRGERRPTDSPPCESPDQPGRPTRSCPSPRCSA